MMMKMKKEDRSSANTTETNGYKFMIIAQLYFKAKVNNRPAVSKDIQLWCSCLLYTIELWLDHHKREACDWFLGIVNNWAVLVEVFTRVRSSACDMHRFLYYSLSLKRKVTTSRRYPTILVHPHLKSGNKSNYI